MSDAAVKLLSALRSTGSAAALRVAYNIATGVRAVIPGLEHALDAFKEIADELKADLDVIDAALSVFPNP